MDRSLLDLRFLFDAVEAELGSTFEQHRLRFVQESGPELQRRLIEWVEARRDRTETALRSKAMDQARDLVAHAIHAWVVAIEPDANALYCTATERFLRLANAHISRVAADAGSLEIEDLSPSSSRGTLVRSPPPS